MKNKLNDFQSVINQLENQMKWFKKEPPFDEEYYQSGKGFQENNNPMRKLTQEECEYLLLRIRGGMELLKKYKRKSYIRGLKMYKYMNLLKDKE